MTEQVVDEPTIEVEKLDLRSMDVSEERRAEILRLFPEVRTEGGRIDFDRLKLALSEMLDTGRERYGMIWPGKADCFRTIQTPSLGTLIPAPDESVNFDTTENLIIEGDNLEVLKLLQKSYLGKVHAIYIDPPYNTGNDFIYPDNYTESLQTYLEYTGQADSQGKKFSTNTEADGRFHSKWMNMIYPRLYLARNLLTRDGVIFISIDDRELTNLRRICDDIFGEASYKGTIIRATGQTTGQDSGGLGASFDYVLVYTRDPDSEISGLPLDESDLERYEEEDERGRYALWQLRKTGKNDRREDRPNMYYPVDDPEGQKVWPTGPSGYESRWRFDPKGYARLLSENMIVWKKRRRPGTSVDEWWPYVKTYLDGRTKRPSPLWDDIDGSKKASRDLRALMGDNVFDNPKPVELVTRLLQIAPEIGAGERLCLDFFAGAGTTAHAVLELNRNATAQHKFIIVQLPEATGRDDYKTIADITKERVRRVIRKVDEDDEGMLDLGSTKTQDRGFRVFKLAESNLTTWNADVTKDRDVVAGQLQLHVEHIREGRTQEDLLFEILLKSGYSLSAPIETLEIEGKRVFSVAEAALLVCLEKQLTLELIRAIADRKPERVVCLDEGFAGNDQLKANAAQIFKSLHRRSGEGESASDVTVFRTV